MKKTSLFTLETKKKIKVGGGWLEQTSLHILKDGLWKAKLISM